MTHKLASGADAHQFTTEDRRKGGLVRAERAREQAKTVRERLADKLNERADELADALIEQARTDYRAFVAGMDQAFGKPTERHELTGADGGPLTVEDRSASLADVAAVLRDTGALDSS